MSVFSDVAVRQGLKMALAGILGFAAALWLRLPNPTWCIFTVIVLMMAQYVGAIAEKAVLRAIGTIVGAAYGVLLVGNFASDPVVMIVGAFLMTAFGTMMFGGNWFPYAFFLAALTTLIVVGTTMESPDKAWHVGMTRIVEITLGIIVSTAVTSIVWPRYARIEFRDKFRTALLEVGRITSARSRQLLSPEATAAPFSDRELNFAAAMNSLRLLLRYGQRESSYFRAKLPVRTRLTAGLGAVFAAAESLGNPLPADSLYRRHVGAEFRALIDAVAAEFTALANHDDERARENPAPQAAADHLGEKLRALRESGLTREVPIDEAMNLASHYAALLDIVARLQAIRADLHDIHHTPETISPPVMDRPGALHISAFWFRNGIKSGITAVLALLYVNWIQPPGGLTVPFAAWLLTATSRLYPAGEGDRRVFSYALIVTLAGIPYALLLLVITPFLAHYFWLNVFLATGLFLLGFTITRQGGIGFYAQCGMLFFIGALGLNAQEPVSFQQIVGVYFGVVGALMISACVQRLLWPLLPQREIFSLFAEFFAGCRELLHPLPAERRRALEERLALIPPELAVWIHRTTTPEYPPGEADRLLALLRTAERLAYGIIASRRMADLAVPADVQAELAPEIAAMEAACRHALSQFETTFTRGRPADLAPLPPTTFEPLEDTLRDVRQRYLSGELRFPHALRFFGALHALEETGNAITLGVDDLKALSLERYRGDYAL